MRYRHVPPNGNRFDMQRSLDADGLGHLVPPCWRRKTSGTTDVFGRMVWDLPAPTIRTEFYKPEKGRYLHPEAHRPITVREGAILMGFPTTSCSPSIRRFITSGVRSGTRFPRSSRSGSRRPSPRDAVERGLLRAPRQAA